MAPDEQEIHISRAYTSIRLHSFYVRARGRVQRRRQLSDVNQQRSYFENNSVTLNVL